MVVASVVLPVSRERTGLLAHFLPLPGISAPKTWGVGGRAGKLNRAAGLLEVSHPSRDAGRTGWPLRTAQPCSAFFPCRSSDTIRTL